MREMETILRALSGLRISAMPEEYDIHWQVERALSEAQIDFVHEYRLKPGRRIDFACGRIGIEIKKGYPQTSRLREQLKRYLDGTELEGMVVVMQKECSLPQTICGKPVSVLALNRLWGVSLP